jgi:hypothetical protein
MPNDAYPYEDSKDYLVAVTQSKLYVAKNSGDDGFVRSYPLFKNVSINEQDELGNAYDAEWASVRQLMPDSLRTPSGDDHIHCDGSIKPTNPDARLTGVAQ